MKVIIYYTEATEPYYDNESSCTTEVIRDNGEQKSVYFGNGEPEDMTLNRDLNDAFFIHKLIKLAYDAGKEGEDFKLIYKEGK